MTLTLWDHPESSNALKVRFLLAELGLDQTQARRYPAGLSGGQLQRAALARALGARPRVLVCDDQFYLKPTPEGRAFLGEVDEQPAYPGARPSFLIDGGRWDDAEWMSDLVRVTAAALPMPKPKMGKRG